MIVVDASAMVEALVGRDAGDTLLDALRNEIHVPHLLDVEVLSALRGLTLGGHLDSESAEQAIQDYFGFTIVRHESQPLADRIWQLRHQFTSYDAGYLALAEALSVPLHTCDAKLTGSGHNAEVLLFARTR
ncbi:MAG: type II toxin-antitoxin system VapC family toxin [Micropruina sp.]|uniref:type II toxin-antitoxin system VapC family toxin n=1 Tax=Micropruina sp. TaxID=2737536 RepID=UPI0039E39982